MKLCIPVPSEDPLYDIKPPILSSEIVNTIIMQLQSYTRATLRVTKRHTKNQKHFNTIEINFRKMKNKINFDIS